MPGLIPPFTAPHLHRLLPPEEFAGEVLEIERELDELFPPWREPVRSRLGPGGRGIRGTAGIEDLEVKARCKALLQRRKYLYDGRNWEVAVLTHVDSKTGRIRMCAGPAQANPVRPRRNALAERVADQRRQVERAPVWDQVDAVVAKLRLPREVVEVCLLDCPERESAERWVRRKLHLDEPVPELRAAAPPTSPAPPASPAATKRGSRRVFTRASKKPPDR